ncbi:MAG: C-terminal target protein, partial [Flavipsychrobacter sp.]|nr:C-terminal target protein [Flavipsychrobacter sp.]
MRFKSLLFISAIAAGMQANAQPWVTDSVEMGAGYANDIFYNLASGDSVGQPANNWDLAFQINKFGDPMFNASIRANHVKKKVEVYSLHMAVNATSFAAVSASDTVGKTSRKMQLMNIDTSWGEGAFTQNRDLTDLFDFGWGKYQGPPNHDLIGDSVYLVKVNGTPYKFWVQQ